jgi:hypothetical protein
MVTLSHGVDVFKPIHMPDLASHPDMFIFVATPPSVVFHS